MKNSFKFLTVAAFASVALLGCSSNDDGDKETPKKGNPKLTLKVDAVTSAAGSTHVIYNITTKAVDGFNYNTVTGLESFTIECNDKQKAPVKPYVSLKIAEEKGAIGIEADALNTSGATVTCTIAGKGFTAETDKAITFNEKSLESKNIIVKADNKEISKLNLVISAASATNITVNAPTGKKVTLDTPIPAAASTEPQAVVFKVENATLPTFTKVKVEGNGEGNVWLGALESAPSGTTGLDTKTDADLPYTNDDAKTKSIYIKGQTEKNSGLNFKIFNGTNEVIAIPLTVSQEPTVEPEVPEVPENPDALQVDSTFNAEIATGSKYIVQKIKNLPSDIAENTGFTVTAVKKGIDGKTPISGTEADFKKVVAFGTVNTSDHTVLVGVPADKVKEGDDVLTYSIQFKDGSILPVKFDSQTVDPVAVKVKTGAATAVKNVILDKGTQTVRNYTVEKAIGTLKFYNATGPTNPKDLNATPATVHDTTTKANLTAGTCTVNNAFKWALSDNPNANDKVSLGLSDGAKQDLFIKTLSAGVGTCVKPVLVITNDDESITYATLPITITEVKQTDSFHTANTVPTTTEGLFTEIVGIPSGYKVKASATQSDESVCGAAGVNVLVTSTAHGVKTDSYYVATKQKLTKTCKVDVVNIAEPTDILAKEIVANFNADQIVTTEDFEIKDSTEDANDFDTLIGNAGLAKNSVWNINLKAKKEIFIPEPNTGKTFTVEDAKAKIKAVKGGDSLNITTTCDGIKEVNTCTVTIGGTSTQGGTPRDTLTISDETKAEASSGTVTVKSLEKTSVKVNQG